MLVDGLIGEGQNPTHFARQLVRFIRNAIVAKVAGDDSPLLQISGDERQRVARIAELFSEDDLSRHLQIMLRTHGELGYRQEQRFHLELGLLKMAHAQRLLPIEQLLSDAAGSLASAPRAPGKPSIVPEVRKPDTSSAARNNFVSPFAADSARKTGPKAQLSTESTFESPRIVTAGTASSPVVMGAAVAVEEPEPIREVIRETRQTVAEPAPAPSEDEPNGKAENVDSADDRMRNTVLDALSAGGHRMLVSMLDSGEWKRVGNDVVITVASSAAVIDMSLGADARKLATATASNVLGRPAKLKVISGSPQVESRPPSSNGGGRSRVEKDPVVQRMKEKFGAEIRTIIDYREKR